MTHLKKLIDEDRLEELGKLELLCIDVSEGKSWLYINCQIQKCGATLDIEFQCPQCHQRQHLSISSLQASRGHLFTQGKRVSLGETSGPKTFDEAMADSPRKLCPEAVLTIIRNIIYNIAFLHPHSLC